ncbi:MAG: hypothetical protein JNN07_14105 [Verrucomicrobiales bacterium]|nr:hypothetical protein [Verrucomicrobiales bacterium]
MKLSSKLMVGFAVPMFTLIALVAGTRYSLSQLQHGITEAQTQAHSSFEHAMKAQSMRYDVVQVQQFLTDVSATRAQDGLSDGFEKSEHFRKSFLTNLEEFGRTCQQGDSEQLRQRLKTLRSAFEAWHAEAVTMAKAYVTNGTTAGNALMGKVDATAAKLTEELEPFVREHSKEADGVVTVLTATTERIRFWFLAISSVVTLGCFPVIVWLLRSVSKPVQKTSNDLKIIATHLTSAAAEIGRANQSLAEGANSQAASLEQTSASLEEISSMTARTAEQSKEGQAQAKQARSSTESGAAAVQEMSQSMQVSKLAAEQMQAALFDLQTSSTEVAKIIKTIDEIAFQTNILALNAAVEAARAGEAGLGFAVVADEVRNLAHRSAQAAKETATRIRSSINKSEGAQLASQKLHESLNATEKQAAAVASGLEGITQNIRTLDKTVQDIACATSEQSQGIRQINSAVSQIDKVTQNTAAQAQISAAAADQARIQVERLNAALGQLRSLVEGQFHSDYVLETQAEPPAQLNLPRHIEPTSLSGSSSTLVSSSASNDKHF